MADPILQLGSRGPSVKELQNLLNKQGAEPPLNPDSAFGTKTKTAVIDFQTDNWLVADGIAGKCTWNALRGFEEYVLLDEPAMLVPQPTTTTCWAASTSMLKNQSIVARGPFDLASDGGLVNDSELTTPVNTAKFAAYHHLRLLPPMSWTARGLAGLIKAHGRLMCDILWNIDNYIKGKGSSGHMVIMAGIRGDGTEDGSTVEIYNPWPPSQGAIEVHNYSRLMQDIPGFTYQIYHR